MEIFERLNCVIIDGKSYVKASDAKLMYDEIEQLRGVLLTVLEACEDVNSPDRKVREEITRTVNKALKGKNYD
jgi:hypothetical protein